VPDGGYHRGVPSVLYVPTAAIVVEVLSPGDETWLKRLLRPPPGGGDLRGRPGSGHDPPDPLVPAGRRRL
jgi:hypothetical protein